MTDTLEIPAVRGSLAAVAGAISQQLLPQLPPDAARSARECVAILLRLSDRLASTPVGDTPAAEAAARDAEEAALAEREARLADGAKPEGQRAFDAAEFERYLRRRDNESPSLRIVQSLPLLGGRSKRTILLTLEGSTTLPAQIVLRQDWAAAITGTSVVSEFSMLDTLARAGIKVPRPLFLEPSADVLGGPFVAVERLPGSGHGDLFHPLRSPRMVEQLAAELARLHACTVEPFERSGVTTDAYTPAQLRTGLERFAGTHAQIGVASPAIDAALAWMRRNVDRVDGPRALLHNDIGCHNLLIDGEDLVAILDWELGQIGNPAADLGYIRGWVSQVVPWQRFMAAYHDAGGPPVSTHTLDFYTLWCGVRLYCLLLQARAGIAQGVVCDTEIAYAYAQFLPLLLRRIAHELVAVHERDTRTKSD